MMKMFCALKITGLVSLCAIATGCATTEDATARDSINLGAETSLVKEDSATRKTSRLRFKDGPLCLCADGLQEDDILNSLNAKTNK